MKSGRQVTIKDIAKRLNISPSTVSRALHDNPSISKKTKEAVLALAEELNYQPNLVALSLLNSRTHTVGMVVPKITQPFYALAISGMEDVAVASGYSVMICQSNESEERERSLVRSLLASRVDGLVVCHSKETQDAEQLASLVEQGVPVVQFDRVFAEVAGASKIVCDDRKGAFELTEHLLAKGYKRIAHIAGTKHFSTTKNRMGGYIDALKSNGMEIDESLILHAGPTSDQMIETARTLLDLPEPPDAIFAVNDLTAIEAMRVIREKGLNIPNQVGLAGFDNLPVTTFTEPELTTVRQPAYEMGQEAARLFFRQLEANENEPFEPLTKVLQTELIARGSTAKG